MYYNFTKVSFKKLIELWFAFGCNRLDYTARGMTKEQYIKWLIENYLPDKFIEDIDNVRGTLQ